MPRSDRGTEGAPRVSEATARNAYARGWLAFRGRRFRVNPHVYLTDPETSAVVDAAAAWVRAFRTRFARPPVVVEFGVGCGTLSISLALEAGRDACLMAIDIDAAAVELARENAAAHRVVLDVVQSDFFDRVEATPDLVFGDPPWGDETTLYAGDRDAEHYNAMPAVATYPPHGRTGVHEEILRRARARGWQLEFLLNFGVLGEADFAAVAPLCDFARIADGGATRFLYAGIGRSSPLLDAGTFGA